jgi:predicted nucleotide-binding protein
LSKGSSSTQDPKRPSHLLTTIEDSRAKLSDRIRLGQELLEIPIRSWEDHRAVNHQYDKWSDYNKALLRRLFDTEEEVDEYVGSFSGFGFLYSGPPSLGDEIAELSGNISDKIRSLESFLERLELYTLAPSANNSSASLVQQQENKPPVLGKEVFIVHGRDEHMKEAAARLVSTLGLEPVILHEQANRGRTIIQKFMDHAEKVVYAIVLLTPDDVGRLASGEVGELNPRARQNVILELGFFLGKLGPDRVCAIQVGNVEQPSDFSGVLYIPYDASGAWRFQVGKEMHEAGIHVDLNKLLGQR